MAISTRYAMIDNYIYLYHTNSMLVLPAFTDKVVDQVTPNYAPEVPLQRSAPIFSYSGMSTGRSLSFTFQFHRELMNEINYAVSNINPKAGDDYVDTLIKYLQSAGYPEYSASTKQVNPPMVAVRLGNDIFIKGVVNGAVGVTYGFPILANGKYADISLSITVSEFDPYSASDIQKAGSYRGVSTSLKSYTYRDLLPSS